MEKAREGLTEKTNPSPLKNNNNNKKIYWAKFLE